MYLQNPFAAIASAFAKKGIVVDTTTLDCKTDGKTIYIPANAPDLQESDQRILHGMLDHEWLHVLRAEQARAKGWATSFEVGEGLTTSERLVMNALLDVVDERWGNQEYPGVKKNLDFLHTFIDKLVTSKIGSKSLQEQVLLGIAALSYTQDPGFLSGEARKIFDSLRPRLVNLPDEPKKLAQLAKYIDGILKSHKSQSSPQSGKSKTFQQGKPTQSGKSTQDESKFEETAVEKLKRILRGDLESQKSQPYSDLQEYFQEVQAGLNKQHIPHPRALAGDKEVDVPQKGNLDSYIFQREQVAPYINTLKTKLFTYLRARQVPRLIPDMESGILDQEGLHRLRVGDSRIFVDELPGEKLDTAIFLLRDFSGSMAGPREEAERRACIVLAETLAALQIPTEIVGFENIDLPDNETLEIYKEASYNRFESFNFYVFKRFDQPLVTRRLGFVNSDIRPMANNSDAEAVLYAARRLLTRKEKRKILICLSDGLPCALGNNGILTEATKDIIQKVIKTGIEVFGLGIQVDVSYLYPNSAKVKDLDELAPALFKFLKKTFMET